MERAFILFEVRGRKSVSYHHITFAFQNRFDHFRCAAGGIGIVSVDHQVAFRIDLAKHSPDHISFALLILMADHSAGLGCYFGSSIGGVIIIDVDAAVFRENSHEISNNFLNCLCLIVAWN